MQRVGHIARSNRRSQAVFSCKQCGYTAHADVNAARNIRARARVSWPLVAVRLPKQLLLGLAEPATSSVLEGGVPDEAPTAHWYHEPQEGCHLRSCNALSHKPRSLAAR